MIKNLILASGCICICFLLSFRTRETKAEKIQWMTIEEAYAKSQVQPRKILVDIYTDWCGWCKVMDKQTLNDHKNATYINQHFYPVKLNAEQRKSIEIEGKRFDFLMRGGKGVHELALYLTNNQLSYPTTVFIDEQLQVIQPVPGFMKAKEFHEVITYFGGNYYTNTSFENYKTTVYQQLFKGVAK